MFDVHNNLVLLQRKITTCGVFLLPSYVSRGFIGTDIIIERVYSYYMPYRETLPNVFWTY